MGLQPNHRASYIENGGQPRDDVELRFQALLKGEPADEDVSYAFSIYENDYKSEVIEAFLLARASPIQIEETLKVPRVVTILYQHLFFDLKSFRDELDIEAYAHGYADSDFGKDLKVCAITLGLDYLKYRFSRGNQVEINIVQALQNMIETGYILSKATRLNPLDSAAAKEARQWMLSAMKGMDSYVRVKPVAEQSSDEFKLVLETINMTTKPESIDLNLKDNIVH